MRCPNSFHSQWKRFSHPIHSAARSKPPIPENSDPCVIFLSLRHSNPNPSKGLYWPFKANLTELCQGALVSPPFPHADRNQGFMASRSPFEAGSLGGRCPDLVSAQFSLSVGPASVLPSRSQYVKGRTASLVISSRSRSFALPFFDESKFSPWNP